MGYRGSALAESVPSGLGHWIRRAALHVGVPVQSEDWALWRRACEGDSRAATKLVRMLTPQAHSMAMQMLRNDEDAQDVVQESFLKLWSADPSDEQGAKLSTYFNTIVLNRCRSLLSRNRETATEDEDLEVLVQQQGEWTDDAAAGIDALQEKDRLAAAMSQLPERQRAALMLWAYADKDVAEIAMEMKIEVNAAHQLLYRSKQKMKQLLEGEIK